MAFLSNFYTRLLLFYFFKKNRAEIVNLTTISIRSATAVQIGQSLWNNKIEKY